MKIKRLFLGLIVCTLILGFNVSSSNGEQLTKTLKTLGEDNVRNVWGGLTAHQQYLSTLYFNRELTTGSLYGVPYAWYDHTVSWVDFDSSEYKVVAYSSNNKDEWKALTTKQACEEYERTHPGWLVMAGINGDGFNNSTATTPNGYVPTFEPLSSFMQEGDLYCPTIDYAYFHQTLGFKGDGSYIVGHPTQTENMQVTVEIDGEEKVVDQIDNNNKMGDGVTLVAWHNEKVLSFFPEYEKKFNTTGKTVIECEYSINRMGRFGEHFIKGVVTNISTSVNEVVPTIGKFYLIDTDSSLSSLKVGDNIKTEILYTGDWADVEESVSFLYDCILDGQPRTEEEETPWVRDQYPRTCIGFREDGSIVLMVIDGRGTNAEKRIGASLPEVGEIFKWMGVKDGYNFDGGGSTTIVVRNNYGGFDVMNTPSDGAERSDGNHFLVVMRDPGFKIDLTPTFNEATVRLDITNQELFDGISNIKVKIGNEVHDYDGKEITFTGLTKETKYNLEITYDTIDIYDETKPYHKTFIKDFETFDFNYPDPLFKVSSISKNEITVSRSETSLCADYVKNIVVHCGSNDYNMGDKFSFVCDGLIDDSTYDISYSFEYHLPTGEVFEGFSDGGSATTLSYSLPKITTFELKSYEDGKAIVNYKYEDEDSVVSEAYILVNTDIVDLTKASGRATIDELDTTFNYELKLVIKYPDGSIESDIIKLDPIEEPTPGPEPIDNPVPTPEKKKGCKKGNMIIISLISATTGIAICLRKKH